ncbi:MAG: GNAT family N-acetyltransferase [Chloroflexota bacterium]
MLIRPTAPEDAEAIIETFNLINADRLSFSAEQYGIWMQELTVPLRRVAMQGEMLLGSFDLVKDPLNRAKGAYQLHLEVSPRAQGRGIGAQLYRLAESGAEQNASTILYSKVREDHPPSLKFAKQRGFEPTGHLNRLSRLTVRRANLTGCDKLQRRVAQDGIRIANLARESETAVRPAYDELLQRLYRMSEETSRDMPGWENSEPASFDEWWSHIEGPGRSTRWTWVALRADEPVGMSRLIVAGKGMAGNGYTAVTRPFRCRGIARALKVHTIQWAAENGIDWIQAANAGTNAPMLAINRSLGYEPLPSDIEVAKHLG